MPQCRVVGRFEFEEREAVERIERFKPVTKRTRSRRIGRTTETTVTQQCVNVPMRAKAAEPVLGPDVRCTTAMHRGVGQPRVLEERPVAGIERKAIAFEPGNGVRIHLTIP